MRVIDPGGGEFLGSIGGPAGPGPSGPGESDSSPPARTTAVRRPRRSAHGRAVLLRTILRRAAFDGLRLAGSPWFWAGGVVAVAMPWVAAGFLAEGIFGGPGPGEGTAESTTTTLRLWSVPVGLSVWALLACAGPRPPGSFWARYAERLLGRVLPCAALSAAGVAVASAATAQTAPAVGAAAAGAALSTGLCGALGASVRAAVVRPPIVWSALAVAALWLGGGNIAAFAALLPATVGESVRHYAVNVERDDVGRLVDYECTSFQLADHESIHPERIAGLMAASPLVLQAALSEGSARPGSPAEFGRALLEMAAVGPAAFEPCLDGRGPEALRPPVPLAPLGALQLTAAAGALALVGARRSRR